MKLTEKGPIIPPPTLSIYPQQVSAQIQGWKNITAATHWQLYDRTKPDGADFYVDEEELGHIHLNGEIHLAIGKDLADIMIEKKFGNKFPYGSNWITYLVKSENDASHAIWLFEMSYRRINGETLESLIEEIKLYNKVVS